MIRLAPNVADSYQTMALIHEALDQPQKALDFMLIAAHMGSKSDAEPWRRLAAQSVELKNLRQAIYCLSRVCKFDLNDVDARWDRAVLLSEIGDVRKAALAFEGLRKMRPDDVEVVKNLARVYHQMQNPCAALHFPPRSEFLTPGPRIACLRALRYISAWLRASAPAVQCISPSLCSNGVSSVPPPPPPAGSNPRRLWRRSSARTRTCAT